MTEAAICPVPRTRDDRKSAEIAAANAHAEPAATIAPSFAIARDILRSPHMRQAGAGAEFVKVDNPEHVSVFFLDGDIHRKRRSQIARYFTPKAIATRYAKVMEQTTAQLIAQLRQNGSAQLDLMSMQLACDVAADIVGLTNSDPQGLSRRIRKTFAAIGTAKGGGITGILQGLKAGARSLNFLMRDIMPAIRARRKQPKDDVISLLVEEGYALRSIFIECMTYASAGMMTTREFIVMVAWHLFDNDDLRDQFLNGGEEVQIAIIDEILRLEPVASFVHRRDAENGAMHAIDIRAANVDEAITGACPFAIDPQRSKSAKMASSWMSFSDGPHRCPGSQVALHETRLFIDALLRVPGITLQNPPTMTWNRAIMGYELHGAIVTCTLG